MLIGACKSDVGDPACDNHRLVVYNDLHINLTHLSSLASTDAVSTVLCRAVYMPVLDALC